MGGFDIGEVATQLDAGAFDEAPAADNTAQGQPQSSFDPNMVVQYKASGKDLSEPLSTVIQRAQRGYDYAQLVSQHKQREAEMQTQQQRIAEMESQWKPYHEYASQNPEWANFVRSQWESRYNFQGSQQAPVETAQPQSQFNLPPQIAQEISELRQFVNEQKQQQVLAQKASEDAALSQEIDSIRKQYPDVDFSHTNPETGESLESQILRHAQENRIFNFSAAFKDFYFDKLMERNVMKAKEDTAKTLTQQHKNGFLASSDKPLLATNTGNVNFKNTSYHQLMDLAAAEFGI